MSSLTLNDPRGLSALQVSRRGGFHNKSVIFNSPVLSSRIASMGGVIVEICCLQTESLLILLLWARIAL